MIPPKFSDKEMDFHFGDSLEAASEAYDELHEITSRAEVLRDLMSAFTQKHTQRLLEMCLKEDPVITLDEISKSGYFRVDGVPGALLVEYKSIVEMWFRLASLSDSVGCYVEQRKNPTPNPPNQLSVAEDLERPG